MPADVKAALAEAEAVQDAFRYVADKVQPSVVEINVTEKVQAPQANPQDQLPWRFFFNSPNDGQGQPDQPYAEKGLGSGIIVRQDGKTIYVLTNNHVAGSATDITVITHDGKEYKGTLVGKDERKDIALVKFQSDSPDVAVANLGDSSARPGRRLGNSHRKPPRPGLVRHHGHGERRQSLRRPGRQHQRLHPDRRVDQ